MKKIIYDFGANTGGSIPYYLKKADVVVAVEANPQLCAIMEDKFAL
jgi:predicted RNA methylase